MSKIIAKFNSRSFWLTTGIVVGSAYFTHVGIMDGAQWITLATVVLGLWQAKDAVDKFKAP